MIGLFSVTLLWLTENSQGSQAHVADQMSPTRKVQRKGPVGLPGVYGPATHLPPHGPARETGSHSFTDCRCSVPRPASIPLPDATREKEQNQPEGSLVE